MDSLYYWDLSHDIRQIMPIPKSPVQDSAIFKTSTLVILSNSLIFHSKHLRSVDFPQKVLQIASTDSFAFILCTSGLWAVGSDDLKSGVFVENNLFLCENPTRLPYFDSIPILKISTSRTHSGLITPEGALYIWGSGNNGELGEKELKHSKPQIAVQASFFKTVDLSCGDKFTAVCTVAGFLFLFCKRKNCLNCKKTLSYPCAVEDLQDDFICKVFANGENLTVLNDVGEVKVLKTCFCVEGLANKNKISEVVGYEGGLVGLTSDKKTIYVWKSGEKGWTCENFSIDVGDVKKIVRGVGKGVGLIGKKISAKGLRRVKEAGGMDLSFREERVTFDEIVSSLGFKGKIFSMDQGKLFEVLEKVFYESLKSVFLDLWKFAYTQSVSRKSKNLMTGPFMLVGIIKRLMIQVIGNGFKSLKECPKKKLNTIFTLSHKFIQVSVEKYWNLWTALTKGYKMGKSDSLNHVKAFSILNLFSIRSRILKKLVINALKPKKVLDFTKFLLPAFLKTLFVKKKSIFFSVFFEKLKKTDCKTKPNFCISAAGSLDIIQSDRDKKSFSTTSQTISNESDKSLFSKSVSDKINQKIDLMKISSFTESIELSPLLPSPKTERNFETREPATSLKMQMSQKMLEKNSKTVNSKLSERSNSKNFAQQSAKPPTSLKKSVSKEAINSKFAKPALPSSKQKTQELKNPSRLKLFFAFLNNLLKNNRKLILSQIMSYKSSNIQTWKSRMQSLACSKLLKVISPMLVNSKRQVFNFLKKASVN